MKLLQRADELRSLSVAKNRRQAVRDWLIIRLSLFSGLRASEICALKVTDCHIGYNSRATHCITVVTPNCEYRTICRYHAECVICLR